MPDWLQSDDSINKQPASGSSLDSIDLHRRLVERLPGAVSVWHLEDPENPESFRFLFLNSKAERITNPSAGFLSLCPWDERDGGEPIT